MSTKNLVISLESTIATIRAGGKIAVSAMETARAYMSCEESARHAANAMNKLNDEWAALPKEKRASSVLKPAIRFFYKNMSTAVSQEKARLKAKHNDATAEIAALYSAFPWRVMRIKGEFVFVTHAEFDAENGHRQKRQAPVTTTTGADETDGDGDKGIDAKAELITSLRAELAAMTAERDDWRNKFNALTVKTDAAKLRAAKPKTGKAAKREAA